MLNENPDSDRDHNYKDLKNQNNFSIKPNKINKSSNKFLVDFNNNELNCSTAVSPWSGPIFLFKKF